MRDKSKQLTPNNSNSTVSSNKKGIDHDMLILADIVIDMYLDKEIRKKVIKTTQTSDGEKSLK